MWSLACTAQFFLPFSAKVRFGLFNFILNDTAGGRKVVFNISDNLCATDCGANFIKMYFDSYEPLYLGRSRSLEWLTEASDGGNVATIIFSSSQKTQDQNVCKSLIILKT